MPPGNPIPPRNTQEHGEACTHDIGQHTHGSDGQANAEQDAPAVGKANATCGLTTRRLAA